MHLELWHIPLSSLTPPFTLFSYLIFSFLLVPRRVVRVLRHTALSSRHTAQSRAIHRRTGALMVLRELRLACTALPFI